MVSVTEQEVRDSLDQYPDLVSSKIETAISVAEGKMAGWNPDWEQKPKAKEGLLLCAVAQTLLLHFPDGNYDSMFQSAAEMVTSLWSSSFMLNKKKRFCGRVGASEV